MVMMTMSASAQSNDNSSKLTFGRLSSYLELRIDQVEPVKKVMAQFESSMGADYQLGQKGTGTFCLRVSPLRLPLKEEG
ncbi:MAG: hypothetical protein K6A32_04670, partial [Bacteroidales bacterium]|nr:hypothetical protein [Bacteroidales bacterium]